jgi:hypothetical protein
VEVRKGKRMDVEEEKRGRKKRVRFNNVMEITEE